MYTHSSEDGHEIVELLALSREAKSTRMKLRYDVIVQLLRGHTQKEVAKNHNISERTVGTYLANYRHSGGIAGLAMQKSPGAPPKLTEEQSKELYACIVTKLPRDVGYAPFVNWTANLVRQWVKAHFGVTYSERGMRDVLYRLKLSFTRPTYSLAKADPEKQKEFLRAFELEKKTDVGVG